MAYQVKNFMYLPNLYVKIGEKITRIENIMRNYKTDRVFVVDDENLIKGFVTKDMIDNIKQFSLKRLQFLKKETPIGEIAGIIQVYPGNNMAEALKIMQTMNMKYLPVCKSPYEKKLIGFIKNETKTIS